MPKSIQTCIGALARDGRPSPSIKIVLDDPHRTTGDVTGRTRYSEWSKDGACARVPLADGLTTSPKAVYDALMGWNEGKLVVPAYDARRYFDTVVGIDTAGPETTCFTPAGMRYYTDLVSAVYDAAKQRRKAGWRGKLLVHTHVGEGAVIDYAPVPPQPPWTFQGLFAGLPTTRSNTAQAQANITTLLAAIGAFETAHPDVHRFVVFRFAHDTWATPQQAQAMHDERVEADVNLESNVATGAYPVSRMPLAAGGLVPREIDPLAANPATNFELNDLLAALVPSAARPLQGRRDPRQRVAQISARSARSLFARHGRRRRRARRHRQGVRVRRPLIAYWNRTDPGFRANAAGIDTATLFENARRHLADMGTDVAAPY